MLAIACGGGSDDDADEISEDRAREFTNHYFETAIGLFTGQTDIDGFINLFAPECREEVDPQALAFVLLFIQGFAPELRETQIEEVDVGSITLEQTEDGVLVSPANAEALRVKVDGEFMTASEFFAAAGFDEGGEEGLSDEEPVLLVLRDGDIYVGDCSELEGFTGDSDSGSGSSGSIFPDDPPATGPGSSRDEPVALGDSTVIEDTWEVRVVEVNNDAWPLVEAEYEFNEEPADGERLLMVTVHVTNVSSDNSPQNVNGFEFKLTGSRNQLYSQFDGEHDCGLIPDELGADLFPGGETQGNVCFRVSDDETDFILAWQPFFDDLVYFALE